MSSSSAAYEYRALGDVCTLQRGFDLPTKGREPGKYPLVTSSGPTDTNRVARVAGPGVVTGRSGSIGNVFFVEGDFWPLNTTLYVKDFHGNDEKYVFYLLQSVDLTRFSSGAGVPTLNRNHIHDERVLVAKSPRVQRRIVAKLDQAFAALDHARANAEANLADANNLFEQVLHVTFAEAAIGTRALPFAALCEALTPKARIKRQDYLEEGLYPIVSQEARLVSGYWNDSEALMGLSEPVIVFGDHTRCLKYVDFDFVVGADGTKVLKPKPGILAAYLYFGLRSQPIPEGGYARHFKLLREKCLPELSMDRQVEIAGKLFDMEKRSQVLAARYSAQLADIAALRQSLLQQAFSGQLT